ncbi:hypothetical protein RB614_32270 [Phytohabitans sp. ZYX-F-186]|uniref:Uncharacterized protein n=1 Tax=Phytohabitans maris TaxID=3071409 RepID=A0ABU0ZQA4_9ACTN|nr:hypothetical protein [Phytohabitans sp. ZYX-F-186]MDQ7909208.1 hypothetical protein [Phytohabitans sp. ZYX-F-186]
MPETDAVKIEAAKRAVADAAAAYQAAVEEEKAALTALAEVKARRDAAGEAVAKARVPLHDAIVAAAALDIRQVDLVKLSGYTRDRIYKIVQSSTVE